MNRLSTDRRAQVVGCLVEGNSIRATVRMTGVAKNTVVKLLGDLGDACAEFQDGAVTGLAAKHIQCDEIWSFCYAKAKNVPDEHRGTFGYGDVWTWVGMDADTKLVLSYLVGERSEADARIFARDLASRVEGRPQVTTDALGHYRKVIPEAFYGDVDFAQQRKIWARESIGGVPAHIRYSPSRVHSVETRICNGDPSPRHISTSYVERGNLTIRMGMRRFTRLTNAFSKKIENLTAAVSLHFMYYNFCRVNHALRVDNGDGTYSQRTPAMASGMANHPWTIQELCGLLDHSSRSPVSN